MSTINTRHKKEWAYLIASLSLPLIIIALLAPLDILEQLTILKPCVDQFKNWVPALSGYIALSSHPQVAAVFFTLSWMLLPLQTALWLYFVYQYGDFSVMSKEGDRYGHAKITLYAALLSTGGFIALFYLPKESSLVGSWGMNNSRIGLAFFGSGGFQFTAFSFSVLANSILNYLQNTFNIWQIDDF